MKKQIDPIFQDTTSECGLACLVMIANYHGADVDLNKARNNVGISAAGMTLPDVMKVATSLGLNTRPVRIENPNDLEQIALPALIHWKMNHFVVFEKKIGSDFVICDPARGRRIVKKDEFSRSFTGIAVECTKAEKFKKYGRTEELKLRDVVDIRNGIKSDVLLLASTIFLIEFFALVLPYVTRKIIDGSQIGNLTGPYIVAICVSLILLTAVSGIVRSSLIMRITDKLTIPGASKVLSHMLDLPLNYYQTRTASDISSRYESLSSIHSSLATRVAEVFIDGILVLCLVAAIAYWAPLIAAAFLAGVILTIGVQRGYAETLYMKSNETLYLMGRQANEFIESIRFIQTIQLYGIQYMRTARFMNFMVEFSNAKNSEQFKQSSLRIIQKTIISLTLLSSLILIAEQSKQAAWTSGTIVLILVYLTQGLSRVERFVTVFDEMLKIKIHLKRLSDIIHTTPNQSTEATEKINTESGVEIEVKNLWFRYSEYDPWIFKGINLKFEANKAVAIVAPSGFGKSTLLKILLGLLRPEKGEVLVNGVNLNLLSKESLRGCISSVLQEDKLLQGSIAQNISMFLPLEDNNEVESCAKKSYIDSDIKKLPMGYDTIVGDGAGLLSGGQRQRVFLARAFFKKPKVLVMDEATSNLDLEVERLINKEIKEMKITRITVAHRTETINAADYVIDLSKLGDTIEAL